MAGRERVIWESGHRKSPIRLQESPIIAGFGNKIHRSES